MPYQIFLVEDHPVMRDVYTRLLGREADFELCGSADSAEQALGVADWASCDLLVTDLSLPGMDGNALAARLRTERPGLPVVVISAQHGDAPARRALAAGARAYLTKDTLADTLVTTLREALRDAAPDAAPAPAGDAGARA